MIQIKFGDEIDDLNQHNVFFSIWCLGQPVRVLVDFPLFLI